MVALLCGVLVAAGLTLLVSPTFVASARVRIVDSQTSTGITRALANLPAGIADLAGSAGSSAITEAEIIRSRPIVQRVVDPAAAEEKETAVGLNLTERVDDLDRTSMSRVILRKIRGEPAPEGMLEVDVLAWDFPSDFEWPLRVTFLEADRIEVSIHRLWSRQAQRQEFSSGQPVQYQGAEFVLRAEDDLVGRSFAISRADRQKTADDLLRDLTVRETVRGSNVITISFPDVDPRRSAAVVNSIVRAYMEHNRQRKIDRAGRSVKFLEAELGRVREDLRTAEEQLQAFGERAGDIALPETAAALVVELIDLDVQKARAELEARATADLVTRIRAGNLDEMQLAGLEAAEFAEFAPSPSLASLLEKRAALAAEYEEEWPELKQLNAEIAGRIQAIGETLEQKGRVEGEMAREMEEIGRRQQGKLSSLPEAQIELLRHERRVGAFGEIFILLIGQLQEAKIAEASAAPSVEVVEWAIAPRLRSSPSIRMNLALGAFLGLLLGTALMLLRELSRPLTTAEQTEEALGAPVLHAVPQARGGGRRAVVVRDRPASRAAESYRALRTSTEQALADAGAKATVVCGARRRDGASSTAANLACSLAYAGMRVLLVDADLRGRALDLRFKTQKGAGLGRVLDGEAPWRDCVAASGVEGLDLLPAGEKHAGPPERLAAGVGTLLDPLTSSYDIVLVHAPAVLECADAAALAKVVGHVLLVCRADRLPERLAREAALRIRRAGAHVLGIVLHGGRRRGSSVV